jgi:hypothetical protein
MDAKAQMRVGPALGDALDGVIPGGVVDKVLPVDELAQLGPTPGVAAGHLDTGGGVNGPTVGAVLDEVVLAVLE